MTNAAGKTIIEMRGISKYYPGVTALDHVDLDINNQSVTQSIKKKNIKKKKKDDPQQPCRSFLIIS